MKVLDDGSYLLDDGTVIPADEIGKRYKTATVAEGAKATKKTGQVDLAEGQSSGPVMLLEHGDS